VSDSAGALSPYRIIDLTTERAWLAGQILRDLGAQVLKVEAPGGDPGRRLPPFAGDIVDPERSLRWWSYNRGKRSVVIDLETAEGRERLLALASEADALLESFDPGELERLGLSVAELQRVNPRLIVTRMTAYGQTGPYANWAASDLVLSAGGGANWMSGDPDRAPVRISAPQYFHHGAAEGAVHTIAALHHARRTGVGQWIDVSSQASAVRSLMNAFQHAHAAGNELTRTSFGAPSELVPMRGLYETADGWVLDTVLFGPGLPNHLSWLREEGVELPRELDELSEADQARGQLLFMERPELFDLMAQTLTEFYLARSKYDLLPAAQSRRLMFVGVNTMHDISEDEQLAFREYFIDIDGPDDDVWTLPGAWAKMTGTPIDNRESAPRIGQHDAEPWEPGRAWSQPEPTVAPIPGAGPFAGLKVWDQSWVGVGPLTAKYLADYGATVVRTEAGSNPDVLRMAAPFVDNVQGFNRAMFWGDYNTSKLGMGLSLSNPEGKKVALELAQWADVVLESFSPGVMERQGLGYESLRAVNPDLVMLSTSMNGQTGPRRTFAGFGTVLAGMGGFSELTGWPDRAPGSPYGAYTDFVAQRFCACALMAAIDHHDRTGEGQYLDVSQYEASIHFLTPWTLEERINGRDVSRLGNRDLYSAPHGVYPVKPQGEREDWVAIAVDTEEQWEAFLERSGAPERFRDQAYATSAGRKEHEDELDAWVTAWTSRHTAGEIVDALQPAVPAIHVHSPIDLIDDPQLVHREHLIVLEHTETGPTRYENTQALVSVESASPRHAPPAYGQDTVYVLRELLGHSAEEVDALIAHGAVETEYHPPTPASA